VALGAWVALVCIMGVLLTALVGGRTAPATELANKVNTVRRALPPHMAPLPPRMISTRCSSCICCPHLSHAPPQPRV
jgi:hypothetical protein